MGRGFRLRRISLCDRSDEPAKGGILGSGYFCLILGWDGWEIACIRLLCGKSAGFCRVLHFLAMVKNSAQNRVFFCSFWYFFAKVNFFDVKRRGFSQNLCRVFLSSFGGFRFAQLGRSEGIAFGETSKLLKKTTKFFDRITGF